MKAFKFSLQKLLDTKLAFEKECESRLGKQIQNAETLKKELKQLKMKASHELERARKSHQTISRNELSIHASYLNWLNAEGRKRTLAIADMERLISATRIQLGSIIRERKTLENLSNMEKNEWQANLKQEEIIQMDEFAVGNFIRRRKTA